MTSEATSFPVLAADARLAALSADARPAFVTSLDGARVHWANTAALSLLGIAGDALPDEGLAFTSPRLAVEMKSLAGRVPRTGATRLERLRFPGLGALDMLACACRALPVEAGDPLLLVMGMEAPRRLRKPQPAAPSVVSVTPLADIPPAVPGLDEPPGARLVEAVPASGWRWVGDQTTGPGEGAPAAAETGSPGASPPDEAAPLPNAESLKAESPEPGRLEETDIAAPPESAANVPETAGLGASTPPEAFEPPIDLATSASLEAPEVFDAAVPDKNAIETAPAFVETAPEPEATTAAPAAPEPSVPPRVTPVRFIFQTDAQGRFTKVSPELATAIGAAGSDWVGRTWPEVAALSGADDPTHAQADAIGPAFASRDTWTGLSFDWLDHAAGLLTPIEMSGLPVFDRDRQFQGFRGFGVCRPPHLLPPRAVPVALEAPADEGNTPVAPAIEAAPNAVEPAEVKRDEIASSPEPLPIVTAAALADGDAPLAHEAPVADDAPALAAEIAAPETHELHAAAEAVEAQPSVPLGGTEHGHPEVPTGKAPLPSDEAHDGTLHDGSPRDGSISAPISETEILAVPEEPMGLPVQISGSEEFDASAPSPVVEEPAAAPPDAERLPDPLPLPPASVIDLSGARGARAPFDPKIVRLHSRAIPVDRAGLSLSERNNFKEIARALGARVEGEAGEGPVRAAEPPQQQPSPPPPAETPPAVPEQPAAPPAETPPAPHEVPPAPQEEPSPRPQQEQPFSPPLEVPFVPPEAPTSPPLEEPQQAPVEQPLQTPQELRQELQEADPKPPAEEPPNPAPESPPEELPSPPQEDPPGPPETPPDPIPEDPQQAPVEDPSPAPSEIRSDAPEPAALSAWDAPLPAGPTVPLRADEDEWRADMAEDAAATHFVDAVRDQLWNGDSRPVLVHDAASLPPAAALPEALLDRLPIGVLLARGEDLLFANRTLLDLLGYDDLDAMRKAGGLDRLFAGKGVASSGLGGDEADDTSHGVLLTTADGSTIAVDAHMQTAPWNGENALLVSVRRPLEGQSAEQVRMAEVAATAAQRRANELQAVLDTATDGVIIIDAGGRIIGVNRSAEALFGYETNDLAGKGMLTLFAPESHRAAFDYLDGLRANGVASVLNDGREVMGRVRQGGLVPLFMTMGRLGEADADRFCAVLRDLTSFKRAEDELLSAKREAEESSSQKSEFLARISHEVRTPLNAIIGFAEVMMEERFGPVGNERYKSYVRDIHASGEHVISLVNDLLDLSKIEAGKLDLTFTSVNLNDVMQQCVSIMQPQANRERIIIRTALSPSLPNVVADSRSLRQIALNLLSNSIKFTMPGGQVIVSTTLSERGEAVLRVRDTGVGMTDKELLIAMEPFRQVATSGGGTGLGLPLTKALVEANRASFAIQSAKNAGTIVEVVFPPTRVLAE